MIRRRNLRTRTIKTLILDEADEMLNKGSVPTYTHTRTHAHTHTHTHTHTHITVSHIYYGWHFCAGFKEQIYDVYRYLPPATQVRSKNLRVEQIRDGSKTMEQ